MLWLSVLGLHGMLTAALVVQPLHASHRLVMPLTSSCKSLASKVCATSVGSFPCILMTKGSKSRLFASNQDKEVSNEEQLQLQDNPNKWIYATLWLALTTYAFTLAPGKGPDATALDQTLLKTMISTPFDGSVNAIFVTIFNALGVLPAVYASLLLPGSKSQPVPAIPFVASSFFLGFFGIGPYLALRKLSPNVTQETKGKGSGLLESKLSTIPLAGFAFYLVYYLISHSTGLATGGNSLVEGFQQMFLTQTLVHVSTIDFVILSLAVYDPLKEDMSRRYPEGSSRLPAWVYCAVPVLGPVVYLLTRPALPKD